MIFEDIMVAENKRQYPRFDSLNLSYICLDENGTLVRQSMGRTLNVSQAGICLETYFGIDPKFMLSMTLALEEDLVDIRGRIIYCRPGTRENFETGVEFVEVDEKSRLVLEKFIRLFKEYEMEQEK